MSHLQVEYAERLEMIKEAIQKSEELATYLDTEEDDDYNAFREAYESQIADLHNDVARDNPTELFAVEDALLDEQFEGLFLPRLLGYAVLRGERDADYKYKRPQDQFQDILMAICNSSNYEVIKQRIGQAIQIGFSLSSDIWITNFMAEINNKKIIQFLETQKILEYRVVKNRRAAYHRFAKQFKSLNFYTTIFPTNKNELRQNFGKMYDFLKYRIKNGLSHETYEKRLVETVENKDLWEMDQYLNILLLTVHFVRLSAESEKRISAVLNELRSDDGFSDRYFEKFSAFQEEDFVFTAEGYIRFYELMDHSRKDMLEDYFKTMYLVSTKGLMHDEVLDAVRSQYNKNDGLSTINDCLRHAIFGQLSVIIKNLSPEEYGDYFEVNKIMAAYVEIFDNQEFNQSLKNVSIQYLRKLLKRFTDKRGRDYQDIKKFYISSFQDLGFMTEKALKEIFKTKRKKVA